MELLLGMQHCILCLVKVHYQWHYVWTVWKVFNRRVGGFNDSCKNTSTDFLLQIDLVAFSKHNQFCFQNKLHALYPICWEKLSYNLLHRTDWWQTGSLNSMHNPECTCFCFTEPLSKNKNRWTYDHQHLSLCSSSTKDNKVQRML